MQFFLMLWSPDIYWVNCIFMKIVRCLIMGILVTASAILATNAHFLSGGALPIIDYTSPNFVRYSSNPIFTKGENGTWEDIDVAGQDIKWNDTLGKYLMIYSGYDGAEWGSGLATSEDLISWTKDPNNPILLPNDHEGYLAGNGSLIVISGTYYYYYQCGEDELHVLTSTDLITWTRANSGNAIMTGTGGQWDSNGVFDFNVSVSGSTITLYYAGKDSSLVRKLGKATANISNPLSFTKQGILLSVPDWSENDVFGAPCPITLGGDLYFLHDGAVSGDSRSIGWYYPNGSYTSIIVLDGFGTGWESNQVFDPAIILKDGSFYLIYAGAPLSGGGQGMGAQLGLAIWTP